MRLRLRGAMLAGSRFQCRVPCPEPFLGFWVRVAAVQRVSVSHKNVIYFPDDVKTNCEVAPRLRVATAAQRESDVKHTTAAEVCIVETCHVTGTGGRYGKQPARQSFVQLQ